MGERAIQHRQAASGFGRELQATQGIGFGMAEPQRECATDATAQRLFGCPQCLFAGRTTQVREAFEVNAGSGQRRRIG